MEYLSRTLVTADPDRATQQLQTEHCPAPVDVDEAQCNQLVEEITPVMMSTLSSWVMETQVDICNVDNHASITLPSFSIILTLFIYFIR